MVGFLYVFMMIATPDASILFVILSKYAKIFVKQSLDSQNPLQIDEKMWYTEKVKIFLVKIKKERYSFIVGIISFFIRIFGRHIFYFIRNVEGEKWQ